MHVSGWPIKILSCCRLSRLSGISLHAYVQYECLDFQPREVHNCPEYGSEMRTFVAIAMALLLIDLTTPVAAQVQPRLNVGLFGGWSEPLPPLKVPPTLRQFVPEGAVLRAIINTQMAPDGETCLLYDRGDKSWEVHLDVVRVGKVTSLFNSAISSVAGLVPFTIDRNDQMLAFAYHVGGDSSDTTFAIFAARAGTYQKIFENQTEEGRMRIFEDSTEHIEVWSAFWHEDPMKTCIWCPHRYQVESYSWQRGQFKRTHTQRTSKQLDPYEIAGTPFNTQPARQAASNPSQP